MGRLKCVGDRVATLDARIAKPLPHTAAPIYKTAAYQRWRSQIIRRAGGKCQAPGCNRAERRMFADHIVELKDGGAPFAPANGQCLCGRHHALKTAAERAKRMMG